MDNIRILIVDDKQENLHNAKKQFAGKNVDLTCCPVFSVAANLLNKNEYDILLTDLMMPGEAYGISENNVEIGKEVPYGLVLAILAKNNRVKHVAILSDISHHSGPIAWAMDRLLGYHNIVSVYNHKDWLRAAGEYVSLVDVVETKKIQDKKVLILAGLNDNYKNSLKAILRENFDVVIIPESSIKEVPSIFIEKEPNLILLIGELNMKSPKHSVMEVYNSLLSIKSEKQKVIVAGWMWADNEDFINLPIKLPDLMEKLSN